MDSTSIARPITQQEVLKRYPCLVARMICGSLGYFTPQAAANALGLLLSLLL